MNIFITGINGFIGRHLAAAFVEGADVVCGSTGTERRPSLAGVTAVHTLPFGARFDHAIFRDVDVLIHCAHDFQPGHGARVVEGTRAIADAARAQGTRAQVFISSLSARADAASEYGATKWQLECYFREMGGVIVRPGTVLGDGGIFGRIVRLVKTFPIVPLLDGGHATMYLIGIHDLCRATRAVLQEPAAGEHNFYYPEQVTLRELMTITCEVLHRRPLLVPLPAGLLVRPFDILKRLGIRLPIDSENLKGFLQSQAMPWRSTLPAVLGHCSFTPAVVRESLA
jgi:nucleoside-diphosphate-sugar epimerase